MLCELELESSGNSMLFCMSEFDLLELSASFPVTFFETIAFTVYAKSWALDVGEFYLLSVPAVFLLDAFGVIGLLPVEALRTPGDDRR